MKRKGKWRRTKGQGRETDLGVCEGNLKGVDVQLVLDLVDHGIVGRRAGEQLPQHALRPGVLCACAHAGAQRRSVHVSAATTQAHKLALA